MPIYRQYNVQFKDRNKVVTGKSNNTIHGVHR